MRWWEWLEWVCFGFAVTISVIVLAVGGTILLVYLISSLVL